MGETTAETLREIDATRAALERDVALLASRLPEPQEVARTAAIAGGGALGLALGVGILVSRSKRAGRRRRLERNAAIQASAIAEAFQAALPSLAPGADADARGAHHEALPARPGAGHRRGPGPLLLMLSAAGVGLGVVTVLRRRSEFAPEPVTEVPEGTAGNGHAAGRPTDARRTR